MTREEMIRELIEKVDLVLSIIQLGACGFNDIGSLEDKYKK